MTKSKQTLTVAIPAFNEEKGIGKIITDVLRQKQGNYTLKKILVYSDGSEDNTHKIVEKLSKKNSVVKLKTDERRVGKYLRMNQAFGECNSDILVVLDADIRLSGSLFLEKMVKVLRDDPEAIMVSSHNVYLRPKTFVGRALYTNFLMWDMVRLSIPNRQIADNFYGMATAFRGSFVRTLRIPVELTDPHLFIYLKAARKKGFRYCEDAVVFQWPIATMKDFDKMLRRSLGKKDTNLERLMKVDTDDVYIVPAKYKLIGLIKTAVREPFYLIFAVLLVLYSKYQLTKIKPDKRAVWEITSSTKGTN